MPIHFKSPDLTELNPKIAVIGVGGAGGNAVNNMIAANLQGVSFVVANTDAQALLHSEAETKIQLGAAMTEGLGAGSRPEIGAAAAEESLEEIRSHLRGLHMVFITAGMGGGTGTGAAPVIAAAARQEGVLTVGVVTKPFHFEGQRRMRSAEFGIELLAEQVDTLIVIPNQNLFRVAVMKTTFSEAFAMADQVLHDGIACITDVMVKEGIINLDFADVNLIMRGSGMAMMGTGEANGENRGREAAEEAITNPLLDDISLLGAKGLLVSIIGGRNDLTLYEVDEAANRVREEVAADANIIIGTAFDDSLEGVIRVSVVVTGLDENAKRSVPEASADKPGTAESNDRTLTGRLGQMAPEPVSGLATASGSSSETGGAPEAFSANCDPAVQGLGARIEPRQVSEDLPVRTGYDDQSIRMPSIEDFSPVGQVLLREREEGGENADCNAGIEAHKRQAGFIERLAGLASGFRSSRSGSQTVAKESQVKPQLSAPTGSPGPAFLDPHAKGGALSAQFPERDQLAENAGEVSEFPSFLRKSN